MTSPKAVNSGQTGREDFFDVVFDGPPSHESGRFVEVEDGQGRSFNAGEWIDRGNGLWALRIGRAASTGTAAPQGLTDEEVEAITYEEYAKRQEHESDFDCILKVVKLCLAEQSADPMADEPRNVEGMTRAEFQDHLRVCLQHDNVRRHERGIPQMTQDEMDSEIRERVERSYPSSAYDYSPRCPGCAAFDSDASEVHFVQGCEGCKARMQKIAGFGPLSAPLPRASEQATATPYDGLTEEFADEITRLCNDAPGSRDAVYAALSHCDAVIVPRASEQADEAVTDGVTHFNWLCSLMPEGFHWGEPLTPDVLSHIASAARAKEPK